MGIGTGKPNRLCTLIVALMALFVVSVTLSSGAWGENPDRGSVAAQSPEPYLQSEPPVGFQSKYAEVNGFRMHYMQGAKVHLW